MKKIIGGLVMITLISVLSGCGLKKSSVNNPLSGKDTDQRIVMCLNNAYPEHNFKVSCMIQKSIMRVSQVKEPGCILT